MYVIKRDGSTEPYDENKVKNSMVKSGVDEKTIQIVVDDIRKKNLNSITTEQLYRIVYKLVSKHASKYAASIYSLKKAIMELGPHGYIFEDFVARIFEKMGHAVKIRQIYASMCITHELDVVGSDFFVECKYHNAGGMSTNIKDVLYSHARFLDLKDASKAKGYNFKSLWVATNTKFSGECVDYAKYWGLNLMGWNYPAESSISRLIDKNKLYPVTLLPSISGYAFRTLAAANLVLIKEVVDKSDMELKRIGLSDEDIRKIRFDWEKIVEASNRIR